MWKRPEHLTILRMCCALVATAVVGLVGWTAELPGAPNLVRNPGFEEPLEVAWDRRTPEDGTRRLSRISPGRTGGHCLVLENVEDAYTRLRQGADKSITVASGSLVELSVWVRSELSASGKVIVQLYSIGEKGKITGQPLAAPISEPCDWMPVKLLAHIPEGTLYCMPYLQIKGGTGRVFFDDVALRIIRVPRPQTPSPKVAVFTDLPEDDPCSTDLRLLFGDGAVMATPDLPVTAYTDCVGALFAFRAGKCPAWVKRRLEDFQGSARPVFMDIRAFAEWAGVETVRTAVASSETSASWTYAGPPAETTLSVTYADEHDGQGTIRLLSNGMVLKEWTLDKTAADAPDVARTVAIPDVKLGDGDRLVLELRPQKGEMCRIDRLEITHPTTPPLIVEAEDMTLGANVVIEAPALMFAKGIRASRMPSPKDRMLCGLRVIKGTTVTRGFLVGQTIPWGGPDGSFLALADGVTDGLEVLARTAGGHGALVRKGSVVAVDILSLEEPFFANVSAYYKYLPVVNTLTNRVRFGDYYPKRYRYAEFAKLLEAAAGQFDAIELHNEGEASDGQPMLSLNLGTEGKPLYFLYGACHGSEWEPGYGLLTFARHLAAGTLGDIVDLKKVSIKILPILNPSGYDRFTRKNTNGVDLNRQGDFSWDTYSAIIKTKEEEYGAHNARWKGSAPFSEPEAIVYQRICAAPNLHCILDFHGNPTATSNKVGVLPCTAKPDNQVRGYDLQHIVNERLRGRYILQQNQEQCCSPYLIERVSVSSNTPFLMNTAARDRYGMLVELTAGYRSSYGTVLQTDVTSEVCRALFLAYPVPE